MSKQRKDPGYQSLIELKNQESFLEEPDCISGRQDFRDGRVYVHDDELKLAIEVALVTARPLLLRGEPGSGKSSLAAYVCPIPTNQLFVV